MESISFYMNNFKTFCLNRGLKSNFEHYVVGDFNMPKVAWASLSSSCSSDNVLLIFFTDLGLNQIINVDQAIQDLGSSYSCELPRSHFHFSRVNSIPSPKKAILRSFFNNFPSSTHQYLQKYTQF